MWTKKHLLITDPIERGLRVIEISLLTEQATPTTQERQRVKGIAFIP